MNRHWPLGRTWSITTVLLCVLAFLPLASAAQITEGFDNIATLPGSGWTQVNNSNPLGTTSWFQGDAGIFASQAGAPDSYIAANFNAANFGGNISLWLLTPVVALNNGVTVKFFTRTSDSVFAPDRLELRLSTNGASSHVGATSTSVGDFGTLLLTINPTLSLVGYPSSWTEFTATVSGLGGPVAGRFGFRYSVTDTSSNADYIGIDTLSVSDVPEPTSMSLSFAGLAMVAGWAARGRVVAFKSALLGEANE